ncbi:hypothetical protein Pcinc_013853 [Petrolisthes cinctipes]|uniref:Uncharacterized protein n=1 Tax=Petrolisthes cinctipes TaxID=88211 RepID=A0AAE1FW26_PETCI|nr:hypothetical protein Pcinc_013853 [Petrolisthes cinctipes]
MRSSDVVKVNARLQLDIGVSIFSEAGKHEQEKLKEQGFNFVGCINYLYPHDDGNRDDDEKNNNWVQSKSSSASLSISPPPCSQNHTLRKDNWVTRMQNLSISCALVCCILLVASAVVGTFGIIQRQISAVLITGVMYILASTFGLFCLTIMHFKRKTKKDCGVLDKQVRAQCYSQVHLVFPRDIPAYSFLQVRAEYTSTLIFETGWSLDLGWGGVVTCVAAALLWLLLARIMRYNPISLS